jgi:hypothetical protein
VGGLVAIVVSQNTHAHAALLQPQAIEISAGNDDNAEAMGKL